MGKPKHLQIAAGLTIGVGISFVAVPLRAQDLPTIPVADFIGCRDWNVLQKILEFSRSGDKVAEGKLVSAAFITGECIRFKWGQQVYPTEWGGFTHSVRLRPAGETVD